MSQHDYDIANAAGAAVRADLNNALGAIATRNSGATAPATTFAYQVWIDTTSGTVKYRNAANSGWIVRDTSDETFVLPRSSNTMLDVSDWGKTIRATSSFTQTFDSAANLTDGWWVRYIDEGTGAIALTGLETLEPGESCMIVCNGSNLKTIGLYQTPGVNSQSAAYTTVRSDANKTILHPAADNNPRTFTIDSNANVPYPVGTSITFVNEINTVTVAITSDTLTLAGAGTTGSRTLGPNTIFTAHKIASTKWIGSGVGVT